MKLNDVITADIASTVKDVLEGKAVSKKEEVKYPQKMYHPESKDVVEVKSKEEAKGYAAKGYVVKEVDEPKSPDGKNGPQSGEKDFKTKHAVKKSGEKEDGTVMKEEVDDEEEEEEPAPVSPSEAESVVEEVTISIDEKLKAGKGKGKADIDYIGSSDLSKKLEKKYRIKIKSTGQTSADIMGDKKNLVKFLSDYMMMDDEDIEDLYPELFIVEEKEVADEQSEKQKRYKAFFNKALKKFGVKSPAELKGDKKKEFFNYVDKNYDAGEGESD